MSVHSRGRICIWEGGSLWIGGISAEIERHAHHAVQVTVAFEGPFSLEAGGARVTARAAIVASDVEHVFRADGRVVHLFVEPESRLGRTLTRRYCADGPVAPLPEELIATARGALRSALERRADDAELGDLARAFVGGLAPDAERTAAPDLRVRKVLAWAGRNVSEPLSLAEAAEVAGLSPGRTRHLFVEETGIAFRSYVLWLKLMRAVERYAAGAALTEAAYEAGFADSAHLSRTFRRMFGTPASALRVA